MRKVREHRMFFGVCGGLAYRLAFPIVLLRVITTLLALTLFPFIITLYFIFVLVMDTWSIDPDDYEERTH